MAKSNQSKSIFSIETEENEKWQKIRNTEILRRLSHYERSFQPNQGKLRVNCTQGVQRPNICITDSICEISARSIIFSHLFHYDNATDGLQVLMGLTKMKNKNTVQNQRDVCTCGLNLSKIGQQEPVQISNSKVFKSWTFCRYLGLTSKKAIKNEYAGQFCGQY